MSVSSFYDLLQAVVGRRYCEFLRSDATIHEALNADCHAVVGSEVSRSLTLASQSVTLA